MLLSTRQAKRGSNAEQPGRDKGRATRPHRVAVVGAGNVGATFSYALLLSGLVGELVLIDVDRDRDAAYEIIDRKGATYYAVATGLLRIVESVLRNQYSVLAVSNLVPGYYGIEDLYLSLPAVIGRAGVEQILHLPLDQEEVDRLRDSAAVLREVLDDLD